MPEPNKENNKKFLIIPFIFLFSFVFFTSYGNCGPYKRENAVVLAAANASLAVVNISSEFEVRKRVNPFAGFGVDPHFESFFHDFFDQQFEQHYKKTSLGSGVIIDGKRGFILTNEHVIMKGQTITVGLKDGRMYKAHVVGADPESDLAVLKISVIEKLPDLKMGRSDNLLIGETVIAIGNPFGFSNTVTTGVISAVHRSIRTEDMVYHDFIQTDASINPGNSGGPLLNINGELIGINTAIYAKAQGIGFATPINKAKRVVADLIKYGEVIMAWIGLTVQNMDEKLARYLKLPKGGGALIKKAEKSGPAYKAGIRSGDVILFMGDKKILSKNDYMTALKNYAPGKMIDFKVFRGDKTIRFSVKTTLFPQSLAMDLAHELFGVDVESLNTKNRYIYRVYTKQGVVISSVRRGSYLDRLGVEPGDIIRKINEITIKDINDFKKAVVKYRNKASIVLILQRKDQLYNVPIKIPDGADR